MAFPMAGTCSLVASRTARAASSPTLLPRPAEPITTELCESAERATTFGNDASGVGVGFSASQWCPAVSASLVLRGDRDDPLDCGALSANACGALGRCPFVPVDPPPADGPMTSP